jgi:hypothetical protein
LFRRLCSEVCERQHSDFEENAVKDLPSKKSTTAISLVISAAAEKSSHFDVVLELSLIVGMREGCTVAEVLQKLLR